MRETSQYAVREHCCPECGEPIEGYGRSDRKFCSQQCKNVWHYRTRRNLRSIQLKVVTALARNHEILAAAIEEGRTSVPLADLVQIGFKPDYVSSFRKSGKRDVVWCYDIKYEMTLTCVRHLERLSSAL